MYRLSSDDAPRITYLAWYIDIRRSISKNNSIYALYSVLFYLTVHLSNHELRYHSRQTIINSRKSLTRTYRIYER